MLRTPCFFSPATALREGSPGLHQTRRKKFFRHTRCSLASRKGGGKLVYAVSVAAGTLARCGKRPPLAKKRMNRILPSREDDDARGIRRRNGGKMMAEKQSVPETNQHQHLGGGVAAFVCAQSRRLPSAQHYPRLQYATCGTSISRPTDRRLAGREPR